MATSDEGVISLRSWLILLVLSIVWGTSFILIKKALIGLTPVQLACLRIIFSAVAFTPLLWFHRKSVDWSRIPAFIAVGATGSGIPAFMYATAQTQVSSSLAGILNSMTPVFTLLIGVMAFGAAFRWQQLWGVLLGFVGVFLLVWFKSQLGTGNPWFAGFILIGTICYGTSVNLVKKFFQQTKSIVISAVSFVSIGPPALIYFLSTVDMAELSAQPGIVTSIAAVTILSLVGTVLATIFFYQLVQQTTPVFAASVAYLMPIVALFWGVLDGEPLGAMQIMGMAIILIGVYVIRRASR